MPRSSLFSKNPIKTKGCIAYHKLSLFHVVEDVRELGLKPTVAVTNRKKIS